MELTAELEQAFNEQITLEFAASMVYRQLAIEMDAQDLPGVAGWLRAQADEELVHANKFIDHALDRGNHPVIGGLRAPDLSVTTVLEVFQSALEHERNNSEAIRSLYRACEAAGDLDSRPLLNWFIEEQIEEESTVSEIIGRVTLIKGDGLGLLRLDEELGQRTAAANAAAG